MPTVNRDRPEFRVTSASGQLSAGFDGISAINFHTLSCRGTNADTFLGISINSGATLPANYQWNPNGASASQTAQIVAYILMVLGKGR